ncbi:MAG: hypothetical protein ACJZ2N_03120 [Candidatus Poseidoniales archaeon]
MDYLSGIESAFKTYIGADSIDKLVSHISDKPMILIAGDQLTGKSTQAKRLADYFSGDFHSVGMLFRQSASDRGITVAQQARLLLTERGIDVEIDYKTCEMIAGDEIISNLGVIEGRQPAYMGNFMASLGKKDLIRIYFRCSIREQALRFLRREVGEEAYQIGKTSIPDKDYATLEELDIEIKSLNLVGKQKVMQSFVENQNRDQDDRHRYSELYGFDYGDLQGYDFVIDTSDKEVDEVFFEVVGKLKDSGFRAD